MTYLPKEAITISFYHGTEGAADADWTKNLFVDGVVSGVPLTVTEVINKYYKAAFTPTKPGTWVVIIEENSERHTFTFKVDSEETLQLIRLHVARIDQQTRN